MRVFFFKPAENNDDTSAALPQLFFHDCQPNTDYAKVAVSALVIYIRYMAGTGKIETIPIS